jgi:RNA polymerase sigma-70 factor (ECF subfamily)
MAFDESRQLFVRLLTQHERLVYAYILRLVPNWNDADEILQETNVRLWEEFDRFEPGSNFGAWAVRVAHYQVLTWRKKRDRARLIFDDEALACLAATQTHDNCDEDERRSALAACLQLLPEKSRDLLARCYGGDSTIRDVAAGLRRSTEAVYKSLQRTRLALHACIERRLAGERGL